MPRTITAAEGDSLCQLAIAAGFLNCAPLRAVAGNAPFRDRPPRTGELVTIPDLVPKSLSQPSNQTHRFIRAARAAPQIRFVHGSPHLPYRDDPSLDVLAVSNYVTDRGGTPDGNSPFPGDSISEFDQDGHRDVDAFKVEVFDPANRDAEIDIVIEALEPQLDAAGRVTGHQPFAGSIDDPSSIRGHRSLKATARKVGQSDTMRFRTCYLRLVVDGADKSGAVGPIPPGTFSPPTNNQPRPRQTLLVTDLFDQNKPAVEILDQLVEARFEFKHCPESGDRRCACRKRVPIGHDRRRLRVSVHVLRRTRGGTPVVTMENARRRILVWMRRLYAQADVAPKLLGVREVDPVANMVTISDPPPAAPANAGGRTAAGNGQLGFTITAPGQASQVVGPITPAAGQTPLASAQALAALVQAPFTAVVSPNPRRRLDSGASCDLVIRGPLGTAITLANPVTTDSRQRLQLVSVDPLPAQQQSWDGENFLVGSAHQRILCKNYDTGDDRVDVFVIDGTTDGNRGEAMMLGASIQPDATRQGMSGVRFSVFCIRSTMDGTDADPIVLSHEAGHVAADVIHATPVHQMMNAQVTGNAAVGASKRIRDGNTTYDAPAGALNFVARLRAQGAGLLENW